MDWRQAVSDACRNNDLVINASSLDENTVVQDVLGKVIVIINTYNDVNFPGSKCLFFNMGISLQESDWTGVTTNSEKYYKVPLQYGNANSTGITMYGTHAQATKDGQSVYNSGRGTWVPSYSDREAMAQNILNWSKGNYSDTENYEHNAWMYIGLGGYVPDDYSASGDDEYTPVSDALNPWINSIVTGMDVDNSYYPVGIVLMNFAPNYSYVLNNILMLNNKYRKAYDPNRSPVDGKPVDGGTNSVQSAAPGYSSGMTDNGANAIGWSRIR